MRETEVEEGFRVEVEVEDHDKHIANNNERHVDFNHIVSIS
jgi:hypothetical protein